MAARAGIRAVGRALDYQLSFVDKIAKMVPAEVGITISKALQSNPSLRKAYETDEEVKTLLDFSMKIEGLPTNCSTHAAGVLITDNSGVTSHVPLWKNDSGIVCQFSKDYLEDLGLLKMDFLGLKTLGIVGEARRWVKDNYDKDIQFDELYKIPTLEPLKLISDGKTECIFQLSGGGMTNFMKELNPTSIEDIIAGISMYRPGPMNEIPTFLYYKRNPSKIHYGINGLNNILDNTYGTIVYQEQCMQIVVEIAGFSKADSDNFRRIISKKKLKEMPKQREWFIHGRKLEDYDYEGKLRKYKTAIPGGLALGHSEDELNKLFDKMVEFAAYAFNKSHAAAYAYVGYITAWFMYYYPVEFMAANLNFVQKLRTKVAKYINYARKVLNIEISPPDINESIDRFKPLPDGRIIYTLRVRGAKEATLQKIIQERELNGKFESLLDFVVRTKDYLDKSTYEGLISCGAFSCFNIVKSQHLASLDEFWEDALRKTKDTEKRALKANRPFDFKDNLLNRLGGILPDIREYPKEIELRLEKHFLGLYLTDNPLYKYAYTIKTASNFNITDIDYEVDEDSGAIMLSNTQVRDRQPVRFVGIVNEINEMTTKKKDIMARIELEDLTGITSALVWPRNYNNIKDKLSEDNLYMIYGYLMISDDEPPTMVVEDVELMEHMVTDRIIININDSSEAMELLETITNNKMAQGMTPIYIERGNLQVLLSKEYWVNINFITNKYKDKAIIKAW